MANNKLAKPKPQETIETLGAKMRRSNCYHDGEVQMLIALGAAHGLKMTFNDKDGTVTIEKDASFRPTETLSCSTQLQSNPAIATDASNTLDQTKLLDLLKPVVSASIAASIQEHPIRAVASVDRGVLLANNETVMHLVNTKWNEWFDKKKVELQSLCKPRVVAKPKPKREIAFQSGDDVVYKVPEEELYAPDVHSAHSVTSAPKKQSCIKRFFFRIYEDMISCWWKVGAYIICMCSLVTSCYLGYKNYRMNNIVKEYGILKPALMHHRDFRDFMKSLDDVLNDEDIDDVLKRLENRKRQSK